MTRPLVALLIFNVVAIATHLPFVTDSLMSSQVGSFVIDVAWLGAGLVFWWPVTAPVPARPRFGEIVKIGYVALQIITMKPLFAFLTFSKLPLYATYELARRVHGLSARSDQQIAGLLMGVGGMLIVLVAVGILFLRWGRREERTMRRPHRTPVPT